MRSEGAGQQPGLGQDLEAVARPEDRATGRGERLDRAHDRREARDGAGAQVVAVGEAAGQHHRVRRARGRSRHATRGRASQPRTDVGDVREVALAPRAGKDDHGDARTAGLSVTEIASSASCCSSARSSQVADLHHRVGEQAAAHVVDSRLGAGVVIGLERDAQRLAAADLARPTRSRASAARSRWSGPPGRRCPAAGDMHVGDASALGSRPAPAGQPLVGGDVALARAAR